MNGFEVCPICNCIELDQRRMMFPQPYTDFRLVICSQCGHGFRMEAREFYANLDIQKSKFELNASSLNIQVVRWPHRFTLIAREINKLLSRSGRTIDIGCGTGSWLAVLGADWEKHGVELSAVAAVIAQRKTGACVHVGPIETYQTDRISFDLITAFAVIEHLTDPRRLIKWAFENLRKRGIFVLMTGDRESRSASRMGAGWPLYRPKEHVHFFSSKSLSRLAEDEGFQIERKEWRPMVYSELGIARRLSRYAGKAREVLGLVTVPRYDHFYLYLRK